MNKTTGLCILLASAIVVALSSCSTVLSSTNTPTPDWQPLPTYINDIPTSETTKYSHYTPSAKFDFHLEFDYPSNWLLTEYINEIGMPGLFLDDPRILTLPTPSPNEISHHPIPNDFGSIDIWIIPSKPGQTPDTELESHKQSYSEEPWRITILKDYKTVIDERDASVLEYLSNDPESSPSLMFNRRIFFMVNGQVYEIIYSVAEKDRGGEFEQGYEYFFKSLKIVP